MRLVILINLNKLNCKTSFLLLLLSLIIISFFYSSTPTISNLRVSYDNKPWQNASLPLRPSEFLKEARVSFEFEPSFTKSFIVRVDDCIKQLVVNGKLIVSKTSCLFPNYKVIEVNGVEGKNKIGLVLENKQGRAGFWFERNPYENYKLKIFTVFLVFITVFFISKKYVFNGANILIAGFLRL